MHIAGVRLCFTELERLFGALKRALRDYAIAVARHLDLALAQFRFWCNAVRPHQHLRGRTALQFGAASIRIGGTRSGRSGSKVEWPAAGLGAAPLLTF